MPNLQLIPINLPDADALLGFELENRRFFEDRINARPAAFYSAEGVASAIETALQDAQQDKAYQFLIKDASHTIVGRINLTQVRRAHFHSAELGYRIAESACGKGYAGEAVHQLLEHAFGELKLKRIEAVTRPENLGSVRVLTRNGFMQYGRSTNSFELAGIWYDTLCFERHARR